MDHSGDQQAALATLIHLVLGGRPKGALTKDIPELFQRFRALEPFARIAYADRASAPELRGRLASGLARWLPNDPAELRRRELPAEPDVRALIENVLGGEPITSERARKVPQTWDDPDPGHYATRSKEWATGVLRNAADLIAHRLLVEDAAQVAVSPAPPKRATARPPTWWLPAFDELELRTESLSVLQTWLAADTTPLLVLDGPPGAGKSSLLISLLRSLTARDGTSLGDVQIVHAILREPHKPDAFDMQGMLRAIVDAGIGAGVDPDLLPTGFGGFGLVGAAFLPAAEYVIAQQPPESPALIVIDGVDQIEDGGREDVIDVLSALVRQAAGTGYRFVFSSRRTLPPGIGASSAVRFRLDAAADVAVLETVVTALLAPLHADDLVRIRDLLVNGSEGSWLWACLNARWIAREFAGKRVTGQIELSHGLQGLWSDAMSSVARRIGNDAFTLAMRPLLACLAVTTTGRLGRNELRWATGLDGERIVDLARQCEPYITREGEREFRLCHPDLGRWVLTDERWGYAEADAHLMLADGLVRMGQDSGWRENTVAYAARFVLDHYIGGLSLDPFRPDRANKIAHLLAVLLDLRFVDRVPNGLELFAQLNKLSLVVPDLNLPRTQLPLAGVLSYAVAHPTVMFLGGLPVVFELSEAETDAIESVVRTGATLLQLADWVHTMHPDALTRPGKAVWAALITGLIDVRVTETGLLDVRLDVDFVRRHLIERLSDSTSLTSALCGATLRLADTHPELLGPYLTELVHHHDRVGVHKRMLPTLLSLLSYHRFSPETQSELVAIVERELTHPDLYDREGQTTLTHALSNALWELPAQQRAEALPRHVDVARQMLALASDREPVAEGALFEQRHLTRLEVLTQELIPPEERDPAVVRRLLDHTRAMRLNAPLGEWRREQLLYDTVRALDLVPVLDAADLDELVAVQREICQLEALAAPLDRVAAEHGLAEALRLRYLLRPADERDPRELREAFTSIRRALADAGPVPALHLPYTWCEIATLLLDHDRSGELAEELRTASADLLSGAELSDSERTTLTAAQEQAEARLAELRAEQEARARRDVHALRDALATATDEDRLTRTIELINSIDIEGEQPSELLHEKLDLLDRLLAEHPATTGELGVHVERVRALTLLALGDRPSALAALFAMNDAPLSVVDRHWLGWFLYQSLGDNDSVDDWIAVGAIARNSAMAAEPGSAAWLSALELLVKSYYHAVSAAGGAGDFDRLIELIEPGYDAAKTYDDALEAWRPGVLDATRANALHNFAYLVAVHRLVPSHQFGYEGAAVDRLNDLLQRMAEVFRPAPAQSQTHFGLFLFMSDLYRDIAYSASDGSPQREAAGRRSVEFARAAVAYAPEGKQQQAKRQLVTALDALSSLTEGELDEFIALGLEVVRFEHGPDDTWWPDQAQITLRALRTRRRWAPIEYMGSPNRETALPIYRELLDRLEAGSRAWIDTMDDYSYVLDDPRHTIAELDEEIEARRLVLPHLAEMGWSSPWQWHESLAGSLLVRATLGSKPAARLADLNEARSLLDYALDQADSAAAKVHQACTRANVLTRLVAEGAMYGPQAIRESVELLGAALVNLPAEEVPITRLRQLPLTIIREMKLRGVWPVGIDAPLMTD